jgi:hypothetical protein
MLQCAHRTKPATYLDVVTAVAAQHRYLNIQPANVIVETVDCTPLKLHSIVLHNHTIVVQTALSKRMVLEVASPKTTKVLAQVTSILAASLSKTDNLQQLTAGTSLAKCRIYLQFSTPKLLKTIQTYVFNYYRVASVAKAKTSDAAAIFKLADAVSHNMSDGEREHMQATVNGSLPMSVTDDCVVELPEQVEFLTSASRALTAFECAVCNEVHNTPCFTCYSKPVCKLRYQQNNQAEFAAWSNSTDAFICNGCAHTICKSCLKTHKCKTHPLLNVQQKFILGAVTTSKKLAHDPMVFLREHLPGVAVTTPLREIKVAIRAMISFDIFKRECKHVLKCPGDWAVGIDSFDTSQVFVAAYGIDKRYVQLRDVAKCRLNNGVQKYCSTIMETLALRKCIANAE